jgi:hypothetical protein
MNLKTAVPVPMTWGTGESIVAGGGPEGPRKATSALTVVYCRAKVYYYDEDMTCSDLIRIRAGNDGYNRSRVIDARCL